MIVNIEFGDILASVEGTYYPGLESSFDDPGVAEDFDWESITVAGNEISDVVFGLLGVERGIQVIKKKCLEELHKLEEIHGDC